MNRPLLLSIPFALCGLSALAQLPRIVVQGSGAPQVFTEIGPAVAAAQAGDHVYLSGGSFGGPALIVDKMLHFLGAGINPDSTGATGTTTIPQQLRITTAASGSSFTGITIGNDVQYGVLTDGSDDDPTNMVFQRCQFMNLFAVSATNSNTSSSSVFDECIFRGSLLCTSNGGTSNTITRCIFSGTGATTNNLGNLIVSNSLFFQAGGSTPGAGLYENCVFAFDITSPGISTSNNCIFTNAGLPPGATGSGNIFSQTANTIFVNELNNTYEFSDDLHLAVGSPGANAGTDGNDIGLYGSLSPYKPGAVPVNPHYQVANIANATDIDGNLPVSITVAAQPN
ncbi:MAG: hypothetical protein IPI55_00650 [Flavobacteriales bacterium]|nr:hypothetical protein [Flavobacteriales bacterium]